MKNIYSLLKTIATCLLFIIISVSNSKAQDSKGNNFWLMFPTNYNGSGALKLFITSPVNTSGTISGATFSNITFTVTANTVTTVTLPTSLNVHTNNTVDNTGFHVVSNDDITVYGLNYIQYTTDAYLAFPKDALGTDYLVMSYGGGVSSILGVVATENSTSVTITLPGQSPTSRTMNQGQSLQLSASDVTGTVITSDKPIGVFGANACTNIPSTASACDHICEMIPPTSTYGKKFATVPLKSRTGGDTWRFMASQNSTTITINGTAQTAINKGQFIEKVLTTRSVIESDKPILVAQYSNGLNFDNTVGDPFMMLIPPVEQFLPSYTLSTVSGFTNHYVNIVAPTSVVGSVTKDGTAISAGLFSAIGSSGYSGAQVDVSDGSHTFASSLPFGAFAYGFTGYDSYGYAGGQSFSPVATVANLDLSPATGSAHFNTNQCWTATVTDQYNAPVADVKVDFDITGVNSAQSGFANTNSSGVATFCYAGANGGNDAINAHVGSIADNATFTWISCVPPTITCPSNISVDNSTGECGANVTFEATATGTSPTIAYSPASGSFFAVGTTTVTATANNSCGTDVCTFDVTVKDTEKPNALCKNKTIQLDNTETASITANDLDNGSNDACGIKSLGISKSSFDCSNFGANYLTLTVTDNNNNVSTCQDTVTILRDLVFDYSITSPVEECSKVTIKWHGGCSGWNVNITLIDSASFTVQTYVASNIANSGSYTWTLPSCIPAGRYYFYIEEVSRTTTWTYGTSVFTINNTAPTITTQASNSTVECDGHGNTSDLNTWLANNGGASATDACGGLTWSNNFSALSDECGATGSATVTFTAKDACGNPSTTTATFKIEDTTAPSITTKASNSTVECDGQGNTSALNTWLVNHGGASASDACSGVTWSNDFSALSDDCGATGSAKVKFTATDDCGNKSTTTAIFKIEDTTAPTITTSTGSLDANLECSDASGIASALAEAPAATDNCTSNPTRSLITDNTYNTITTAGFTGSYAPSNWSLIQTSGGSGSVNTSSAPNSIQLYGSDGGGGGTKDTRYQISVPTAGTITFSWSYVTSDRDGPAFDPFGYYLNGTFFQLTSNSSSARTQSGTKSISVSASDKFAFMIRSTDNVLGASTTVASNFTAVTQLCANEYIRVRTWNFKDDCNNTSAFFTQTIHVKDNTAPVINTQASNSTLECDGQGNTSALNTWLANHGGASASDACGGVKWSHNFTSLSDDCGATGSAVVTFTATDDCGNKSTTTATFKIEDTTAPTISTQASNSTVECDGSGNTSALNAWLASNGGASASDACGGVTWSQNFTSLSDDCGATGSATVIYTATDDCGNKSTTTATFTIEDKTAPIAICKAKTITLVNGTASIVASDINNGSYDVCSGGVTLSASKTSFNCTNIGANTVTLTVTDACGNKSTCDATVTVVGTIPSVSISQGVQPVFCQGGAVVLSSTSNETVTYAWSNNATTANTNVYASGTYSLTVTNSYGCTKSASTTVAYSQTDLLSSYTILTTSEAEIEKESIVKSGGVGSKGTKEGEVEVSENSLITASGTFAKAKEVEIKSGSSVTYAFEGTPVSVSLPTFAYNPYCDDKKCDHKRCDHKECKKSGCSHSACNHGTNDVKAKKDATVVITDSIFRKIQIESGATVTFTSKNIYAETIETEKNVTIKFGGCTRIFLCKDFKINENNVFNSANNSVIIYAEKKAEIQKGTKLIANIYTLDEISTKGDKSNRNSLTGMYIAQKLDAHYTDFSWNTVCGSCGSLGKKTLAEDLTGLRDASVDYVSVYPNPTSSIATVSVNANHDGMLKIKVISITGELLYATEKADFTGLAEIPIDMTNYSVGMYFIKVEYGSNIKLFKINRLN